PVLGQVGEGNVVAGQLHGRGIPAHQAQRGAVERIGLVGRDEDVVDAARGKAGRLHAELPVLLQLQIVSDLVAGHGVGLSVADVALACEPLDVGAVQLQGLGTIDGGGGHLGKDAHVVDAPGGRLDALGQDDGRWASAAAAASSAVCSSAGSTASAGL